MTIIDLPSRDKRVTKRPTIATPVLTSATAERCIASIDEDLDCLYCVFAALSGSPEVPGEAVEALRTLHRRIQRNVDTLYTLG